MSTIKRKLEDRFNSLETEVKKLKKWGENGKKYVEENHTFSYLTELLISTFE